MSLHLVTTSLDLGLDGGTTRAALNDSWKTARLSLSAFQDETIRLRFTNAWGDVRSRLDQVYMLGSTQALATPGDTSSCLNKTFTITPWVFNVDVSGDDGLMIRNAQLGPRLMAKEIALPYGVISFKNSQGTVLGTERFELKAKTDKGIKSSLLSCTVTTAVAYAQHPTAGVKYVINARYEVTNFKTAPNAKLNVSQVYEFYPEIAEDDFEEELACEPSNNDDELIEIPLDWISHFSCARWKPIVRYEFVPNGTALLKSVTFAQRLHFTPDGEPLRGSMVIHDCQPGHEGTLSEPCMFTL